MIVVLISAFLLGLAGSFHCAGMCGPIAITLPLHGSSFTQKIFGGVLYNLGRTLTYSLLGVVFGLIGHGLYLLGFQQVVSIIMGAGMIILALFPKFFRSYYNSRNHTFGWIGQLKSVFHRLFSVHSFKSLFFIGIMNGLLPCGLVYIAVAGALSTGYVALGSFYMILFGLGTIPMLMVIATVGNVLSISLRHKINKMIPVLVIIVGIFFILRGLNLGISMLSPTKDKIEKKFEKILEENGITENHKIVVYQMFTRLFGNTNTTNKPWGTIRENGVGKFNDITDKALQELKALGITHIWFTGVLHHAMVADYTAYGIPNDDPDVVKGRAGSPYAIKDYYNVDPDLAVDPAKRLDEFRALIVRTHRNGMKVIIDIVPNHVARVYHSISQPEGTAGFGTSDDKTVEYKRDNNFYYIPGKPFEVPDWQNGYKPLGGEKNPLVDSKFDENPAKWTGNGTRKPKPSCQDWYETVKLNYGVKPDGTKDFDSIPVGMAKKSYAEYCAFWQTKPVPDTWKKFRSIVLFWLNQGVDGFRFDIAQMVPVEFWNYFNSTIKSKNPDAFLLAEIYNPAIYREYINLGKMDYLYDKVDLYDTLKHIIRGNGSTDNLPELLTRETDIEHHILHFLENHDEQRIASPEFAGDANKGKPAMVLSATISTSPVMIYFGQEVGEPGAENGGFGTSSRTSIFDYVGVPHLQRWVNNGKFDGGKLKPEEAELRDFYKRLLNFTIHSPALTGNFREIHTINRQQTKGYNNKTFSYVRWNDIEKLLVICNFDGTNSQSFDLIIPEEVIKAWKLNDGTYKLNDQLYGIKRQLVVSDGIGKVNIILKPLKSLILKVRE